MDLVFRIAAVGILIAIIDILLVQIGKKEFAIMTSVVGMIIVLSMVAKEITGLFDTMKRLFGF